MKRYLSTLLLASTLIIGEIHVLWEGGAARVQNWIWRVPVPMPLQWNIKYVCDQVNWIIVAIAIYKYTPSRVNKSAAATYIMFQITDTLLYFYNYKTYGYGWVYLWLILFGTVFYHWNCKMK